MFYLRICCYLFLLLICFQPAFADQSPVAAPTILQVQHENTQLKSKVRRLEGQVRAMRNELNRPSVSQVMGGIGYIAGIFGVVSWMSVRKKKAEKGEQ